MTETIAKAPKTTATINCAVAVSLFGTLQVMLSTKTRVEKDTNMLENTILNDINGLRRREAWGKYRVEKYLVRYECPYLRLIPPLRYAIQLHTNCLLTISDPPPTSVFVVWEVERRSCKPITNGAIPGSSPEEMLTTCSRLLLDPGARW